MNSGLNPSKLKSIKALQNVLEDPLKMRYLAKELFKLLDADNDDSIDFPEMYKYMTKVSESLEIPPPNMEDVKEVINTFDMDNDFKISIEEFEIFVRELIDRMIERELSSLGSKNKKNSFM
jgi:Ca2+-binding EF-hand superfamily protein